MKTNLKRKLFFAAFGLTVCFSVTPSHATRYVNVTADTSTLFTTTDANGAVDVVDSTGRTYDFAVKYDVNLDVFWPDISTAEAYDNGTGKLSSFEFLMSPNTSGSHPGEKMLMNLVDGIDSPAPSYKAKWGKTNAMGFAVYLASDFDAPHQTYMLWEYYQTGSPTGAILQMDIDTGSLQWGIDNNTPYTDSGGTYHAGGHDTQGNILNISQWYYFIAQVTPNYSSNGEVIFWQNGVEQFDDTTSPIGVGPGVGVITQMNVCCGGQYRGAGDYNSHIYEDLLRWGDAYSDVVPNVYAP